MNQNTFNLRKDRNFIEISIGTCIFKKFYCRRNFEFIVAALGFIPTISFINLNIKSLNKNNYIINLNI